jgi:hypothetical protein
MDIEAELKKAFPAREEYVDCAGQKRVFELCVDPIAGPGYLLAAREITDDEFGYEFAVFSETDPFGGFVRLRDRIRRGLAQRYFIGSPEKLDMSHDELAGWISHKGLVVDGQLLRWASLKQLLQIYEGSQIQLRVCAREEEWRT